MSGELTGCVRVLLIANVQTADIVETSIVELCRCEPLLIETSIGCWPVARGCVEWCCYACVYVKVGLVWMGEL